MSTPKILLVDDNKGQRVTLESILKRSGFDIITADCGSTALEIAERENLAAALVDIKMPDITGIDVLKVIKGNKPDTFVIMMTGYAEIDYAIEALNAGASAYLLKPANVEQIKLLLKQAMEFNALNEQNRAMAEALKEWSLRLEEKVAERTVQLEDAQRQTLALYEEMKRNFESTMEILSIAIDQRDPLTASHSFRVTEYALEMARLLGCSSEECEKLRYAGLMHDLGKIEIKEQILRKEGSLTADEYTEIQTHAVGTYTLLSKFRFKRALADVPQIASSHHERFDGNGYPRKLKADQIPFLARILAVADVLDAITSKRHYRSAMSIHNALGIVKRESGGHFDPACTEALFRLSADTFLRIHLADHLDQINPQDLVDLESVKMGMLFEACEAKDPSSQDLERLQSFYRYYQGPVPAHLEGKIQAAPKFE